MSQKALNTIKGYFSDCLFYAEVCVPHFFLREWTSIKKDSVIGAAFFYLGTYSSWSLLTSFTTGRQHKKGNSKFRAMAELYCKAILT